MNTQHTPGPWVVLWGNYTHFATINKSITHRICAVDISDHKKAGEASANVKLMAAAPEMFEALQNLIKAASPMIHRLNIRKGFSEKIALNEAIKAIKKATE